MLSDKNFDPTLLLILSAINIYNNEIYAMFKSQKVDKSRISFLSEEIELSFDLSSKTTGVNFLIGDRGQSRHVNSYNTKKITVHLDNYLNHSQSIVTIDKPETTLHGSHYPIPWSQGSVTIDQTLDNYLKIGWASTKDFGSSLTLSQYYDFIELSTTFEQ